MKIGVMADTHDNLPMLRKAIGEMKGRGAEVLLHCGDIIAPFAVKELARGGFRECYGVFGNNDGEVLVLHRFFSEIGRLEKPPFWLELEGVRIAMFHEPLPLEVMMDMPCDLAVFGHTHEPVVKKGRALVVNPGECCGYTSGRCTVAVVDTESMEAEVVELS